ncbi:MAG: deaminase [Armatimonadota bacterium]|jgi:deoxycytidylate deaminase/cytidylate kinase
MPVRHVLGITGHFGAGRTTTGRILSDRHNYNYLSMSGFLLESPGEQVSTEELQRRGTALRREFGDEALAKKALAEMENEAGKYVVDGIKHPAEAHSLAKHTDFFLLAVQASRETRWERLAERLEQDHNAFDAVDRRDNKERDRWGARIEPGQRVADCLELADAVIWNDKPYMAPTSAAQEGTLAELAVKIGRVVSLIEFPGSEPPFPNEIRMAQAYAVSRRSSCPQRKVGAVITNADDRIIAEGYNEVPPGQPTCLEQHMGCYRRRLREEGMSSIASVFRCPKCQGELTEEITCRDCSEQYAHRMPDWRNLDYCRALHAEENALLQVSRYGGTGVEGGTIYTTTYPCALCAKKIVQCGIRTVVFTEPYTVKETDDFFRNANAEVHCFEGFTHRAFRRVFHMTDWEVDINA